MGRTYQDRVVSKAKTFKRDEVIKFVNNPNYDNFMVLVKSDMDLEEVQGLIKLKVTGIGEGILNKRVHQLGKRFSYFDTFNEWRWFDLYTMDAKDCYHFWRMLNKELYQPSGWKERDGYKYLTGNEDGVYYIFQRFFSVSKESKYTHWMLDELSKLPVYVLNQMVPPESVDYPFDPDSLEVELSGNSLAKEFHFKFKDASKQKNLESDWAVYFKELSECYEIAAIEIKKDPRYKSRFIRWLSSWGHALKQIDKDLDL